MDVALNRQTVTLNQSTTIQYKFINMAAKGLKKNNHTQTKTRIQN